MAPFCVHCPVHHQGFTNFGIGYEHDFPLKMLETGRAHHQLAALTSRRFSDVFPDRHRLQADHPCGSPACSVAWNPGWVGGEKTLVLTGP